MTVTTTNKKNQMTTSTTKKNPMTTSTTKKKNPTTTSKKHTEPRPVLVTTAHRGVFFGYATSTDGDVIVLDRSRLCVYWSADVRGFMGLASKGPTAGCRIGPPAKIELRAITSVTEVEPAAVIAWETAPWHS